MKVDSLDNSSSIRKLKQRKTGLGGFSLLDLSDEEDEVGTVSNSAKIPSLNPFLALQEISEDSFEKNEEQMLLEEGGALINYLKDIRLGLLNGDLSIDNIRNLKQVIESNKYKFTTQEAQEIYDEIYLRASVELAKLERSQDKEDK